MARRRREPEDEQENATQRPPAMSPDDREKQLILMAVDLAERQLRDGTASSQTINHYLKMSSSREQLEQERLAVDNELLRAKIDAMASAQHSETMYAEVLIAMRSYSGQPMQEEDPEEYND